jgi:hypothetical protein
MTVNARDVPKMQLAVLVEHVHAIHADPAVKELHLLPVGYAVQELTLQITDFVFLVPLVLLPHLQEQTLATIVVVDTAQIVRT